MNSLTLITDWHDDALYLSMFKGKLHALCPGTDYLYFGHLPRHNMISAAFVINEILKNLQKETVVILGINSSGEQLKKHYLFLVDGKYILSADNGLIGLLDYPTDGSWLVSENHSPFAEKDILLPAACTLINKEKIQWPQDNSFKKLAPQRAITEDNKIRGQVIYIDKYGNAITNISKELFEEKVGDKNFVIFLKYRSNKIFKIHKNYIGEPGEFIAFFNSSGYLEISQIKGNISELLRLDTKTSVTIEFEEYKLSQSSKLKTSRRI